MGWMKTKEVASMKTFKLCFLRKSWYEETTTRYYLGFKYNYDDTDVSFSNQDVMLTVEIY